ncbi:sensor domain-containing diguanylate cyclase [Lysinibacillus yapensis]|nr:sensor domain-containing diguanylate cyclase [Lysinibacillus yapensis]
MVPSPNDESTNMPNFNYEALFEFAKDPIIIINPLGDISHGNSRVEEFSGFAINELKNRSIFDFIVKEDLEKAKIWINNIEKGISIENSFRFVQKNGEVINFIVNYIPIDQAHLEKGIFLVFKDMRSYDSLINKYRQSELNFKIIAENVQDVIILMNEQKEYLYVSPSSKTMFAFDNEMIGEKQHNPFFNIHEDDVKLLQQSFEDATKTGKPYHLVIKAWHGEKGWVWTEMVGTPVFDAEKYFRHMVLVARDITRQKEQQEKLEYYAYHDTLTGLPNRRYFEKRVSEAIDRLNETGQFFALILFDIDDFKKINDTWGHNVGDQVIQEVANRTKEAVGELGMPARLGGDEFIVMIDDYGTEESVTQFIHSLQEAMRKEIKTEKSTISISTSIGATICTEKHKDVFYFYKRADHALYHVKEKGKNQYHINCS